MSLAPGSCPGRVLAHYRIAASLGSGGMGEVYRATDTKLGRDVALKVLPAEMAERPERLERFRREAKALAALDHPGIVTVHSVEEADGVHFLTMQLVEGEPLDRLVHEGGMPVARVVEIALALAEALAAAHDKGIVHRDLKPANVMVASDGRVKVLDFGLARMNEPRDAGSAGSEVATDFRTREGVVMGTVPYMSPEQVSGREVDHRSDLFSLGVILYEIASGERPFRGSSSAELASAILRDAPIPLCERRPELPEGLVRAIDRCLEKSPGGRFASAREARDALRGTGTAPISAGTAAASAPTSAPRADSGAARAEEGFWIAVLPFKHRGSDPAVEALAEGLTDEIVTGLARFSYLRVIARSSTSRYGGSAADVREIAREIGARFVMEGSLRQAGAQLRVAVQLVDATTGTHLWAETYNRPFAPDQVFAIQDDLVPRIVSTSADHFGVLARAISEAVRTKPLADLTPYEALMRGFGYHFRLSPEEHAEARDVLEKAVERAPSNPDCWAMLSWVYSHELAHGFNPRPGSLDRALVAARRAADLAPSNHIAQQALAVALFFRKETASCRAAAERALALNPIDGSNEAISLITFTGDWDRGTSLIRRAMELNPHHPRWYELILGVNEYRLGRYREAAEEVLGANLPESFWKSAVLAAAFGQLGEAVAAGNSLDELLAQRNDFARSGRDCFEMWFGASLADRLMEGLRKAGLEDVAPLPGPGTAEDARLPWIAVLPFKVHGEGPDLATFADGLGEDVTTGLARFPFLHVVSRNSLLPRGRGAPDLRTLGRELGFRYALEGAVRRAGGTVRVSVQLSDARTGTHLWAESYDRELEGAGLLAVQDDVTDRVVATVADPYGVLVRSMASALRDRPLEQLTASELVLRFFAYWHQVRTDEHARLRAALERRLEREPAHADGWACLARLYSHEHSHNLNPLPGSVERARRTAERAVEIDPTCQMAWESLADASYFAHDLGAFQTAAERAMSLNPRNTNTVATMAVLIAMAGDPERGVRLASRAMALNPHHPGWYHVPLVFDLFRKREYEEALQATKRINMPGFFWAHLFAGVIAGRLGRRDEARAGLESLRGLFPHYREELERYRGLWIRDPAMWEELVKGLAEAEALASPPGASPEGVSIAVLPFSDMSSAKDQAYLCEGMAEEVMNALVRVRGIRVASRTSAFRASRDEKDLAAIGKALGVDQVLEGSVRMAGTRLRVTAQLSDVASGYQVWSERYDREAADVFAVQDEIAAGVVDAVKARLSAGAHVVTARAPVRNLEAYQHYLKGRHLRYTMNDHGSAVKAFEEAVRLDPSHAPSWVGLAEVKVLAAFYGLLSTLDAYAAARQALAKAQARQGESAEACYVEGMVAVGERDWAAAERALRRAVELRPDFVQGRCWYAILLSVLGRGDEALPHLQHARETDPLAPYPYAMSGTALLVVGRAAEAERLLDQALAFEPENTLALWEAGLARIALGKHAEGLALVERARTPSHRGGFIHGVLGWALAMAGRIEDARKVRDELRGRPSEAPTLVSEAWLLGALGERDAAFRLIERAEGESQVILGLNGLPGFDVLRDDPRFDAFLARLGLPSSPTTAATGSGGS